MVAWFISDIHIKDINERNSILLLRFLRSLNTPERPATHLILLGDIFDLWVGDSLHFQRKFQALVDQILFLKRSGVEILYFEGNHDLHLHRFWSEKYGIPVHTDHLIQKLGPWAVRMEHGDLINHEDLAYLRLRRFLRSPQFKGFSLNAPGSLFDHLGQALSKISRKKSSQVRQEREASLRQMIRAFSERVVQEDPFDYVISGHMHIRDEYTFQFNEKPRVSINLGSWFEEPMALRLDEKGHHWISLS